MFRFLDPRGRANFGEFRTVSLICLVLATVLMGLVEARGSRGLVLVGLAGLWTLMIVMWIAGIRRVHDGDESVGVAPWVMTGPTIVLVGTTLLSLGVHLPLWLVGLGFVPVIPTAFLWVGFLQVRDSPAANRFGPSPAPFASRLLERADEAAPDGGWPLLDPRGRSSRATYLVGLVICGMLASPLVVSYPSEIQESRIALECELDSRGLDTATIFEGGVEPKVLRASKSWRLLFQIDSDPDIGMMWGDAGMLYVFIREADARAGDFSRTWLISQSH